METIIRPMPVPAQVATRSALLALANLGAELHSYNEENRTIVARLPKWFGVTKASVLITVQDYGENSRLELQLPDKSKADELLRQISLYLVDGHRAAGDMSMRWAEKQEPSVATVAGKQVGKVMRRLRSGTQNLAPALTDEDHAPPVGTVTETAAETVTETTADGIAEPVAEETAVIDEADEISEIGEADEVGELEADAETVIEREGSENSVVNASEDVIEEVLEAVDGEVVEEEIADEASHKTDGAAASNNPNALIVPDFITADQTNHQLHIAVKPDFFTDRSGHLETCNACGSVVMRGSQFCGNCGRPVTMKAVSKEVNEGGRNTARSSLIFGILAIATNLVTLYFLVMPALQNLASDEGNTGIPVMNLLLAVVLGILPSLFLANEARRMAKTAEIYIKFRFNKEQKGRSLSYWGRLLGWISIYINIGIIVFLIARNFL